MIIDTTISTTDKHINLLARAEHRCEFAKKQRFFPGGIYDSRREQLEFRDMYVREFLESKGLDSDINLRCTLVFWEDGEIVAVLSCKDSVSDRTQNIAALLM